MSTRGSGGKWLDKPLKAWHYGDLFDWMKSANVSSKYLNEKFMEMFGHHSVDGKMIESHEKWQDFHGFVKPRFPDKKLHPILLTGACQIIFNGMNVHRKPLKDWSEKDLQDFIKSRRFLKRGPVMAKFLTNLRNYHLNGSKLVQGNGLKTLKSFKDWWHWEGPQRDDQLFRRLRNEFVGIVARDGSIEPSETSSSLSESSDETTDDDSKEPVAAGSGPVMSPEQRMIADIYTRVTAGGTPGGPKDPGTFDLNLMGKQHRLHFLENCRQSDTIEDIKRRIVDEIGGQGNQLDLRFMGRTLHDLKDLGSYDITSNRETVMIVFRLPGGNL